MGMMGKMRSLAPWFILTVGGLFVLFMILSDSNLASYFGQQRNIVGTINGVDITYQEFSQALENARAFQQQQGRDIEESQMIIFRDQVWNAIVTQKLLEEKIEEFDIRVTDEEIRDALLGPNPPADLRQSFIDSTGNFDRVSYENALFDPRNREILLQLEDRIRQEKMQSKLQSMLFASINVTDTEIERRFMEQNIKMSAEYAFVNSTIIPDTSIEVSSAEIENYYNEHKEDYSKQEERKIKYVLFRKQPSPADTANVLDDLKAILEDLESDTSSFKTYAEIYSEDPYSVDSLTLNVIPDQAKNLLIEAKKGQIVGPVLSNEGYIVYKLIDKRRSNNPQVRASHILIKGDSQEARNKADEIYTKLRNGADFSETAVLESEDKGSAIKGGDVGWFGKGQMVDEFANACFNGRIGVVQRPVKSQYGYHIIKVTGKNSQEFVVEKIVKRIIPSGNTLDKLYSDAGDFSYLAQNNGFESEAELLKYDVRESYAFNEEAKSIPGLGQNDAIVKFAFENSEGDVSDVFNVPAGYVVTSVSEVNSAGFRPLDEVEASIKSLVRKEKKNELARDKTLEIRNAVVQSGDLQKAKEVDPAVTVSTADDFTAIGRVPGVGNEIAFSEYSLTGELNQVSEPVLGSRGYYLVKVINRTPFDSTNFSVQKYSIRENLMQQKKSRVYSQWIAKVQEEADIEDFRYRFWR